MRGADTIRTGPQPERPLQSPRHRHAQDAGIDFSELISSIDPEGGTPSNVDGFAAFEGGSAHGAAEAVEGAALPSWYPLMNLPIESGTTCGPAAATDAGLKDRKLAETGLLNQIVAGHAGRDEHPMKQQPHLTATFALEHDRKDSVSDSVSPLHGCKEALVTVEPGLLDAERQVGVADINPDPVMQHGAAAFPSQTSALALTSGNPITSPAQQIITTLASAAVPGQANRLLQPEVKILRFGLMPEELGDVEVMLRYSGRKAMIHITVSSDAAADSVRRDITLLEDRLAPLLGTAPSRPVTVVVQVDPQAPDGTTEQDGRSQAAADFGTETNARDRQPSPGREESSFKWDTGGRDDKVPSPRSSVGQRCSVTGLVV